GVIRDRLVSEVHAGGFPLCGAFVFFFQAEDGIRDFHVTGVQTCALPILFFGFIIWTSMTKLMRMPKYALNERPKQFSLLNILLITTLIALGVPTKTGAELFFIIPPAAIVTSHFFEERSLERPRRTQKAEIWFKEILLWFLVATVFSFIWL